VDDFAGLSAFEHCRALNRQVNKDLDPEGRIVSIIFFGHKDRRIASRESARSLTTMSLLLLCGVAVSFSLKFLILPGSSAWRSRSVSAAFEFHHFQPQ